MGHDKPSFGSLLNEPFDAILYKKLRLLLGTALPNENSPSGIQFFRNVSENAVSCDKTFSWDLLKVSDQLLFDLTPCERLGFPFLPTRQGTSRAEKR